ncbi:MAG: glycosyltransferase family 2 protein [Pseudomonadota bacterium]
MHSNNHIELSVVMPCLNEETTIGTCIAKALACIKRIGVIGEVVVADNGSTDSSCSIASKLGARVISVLEKGYGSALIAGINASKGRYIIMGDSDDSYDFSNLDKFLVRLREGDDLVMGNRFKGGIAKGAMPALHKYIGNPALSFLGRVFCKIPVGDFHCGLRGFNREKIQSLGLICTGMEFASELVVKAANRGLTITEIPVTLSKDGRDRPPHLRSFRDGWRHLKFLFLASPNWLFLYPGLMLLLFSLAIFGLLLAGPLAVGKLMLDIHSLVYVSTAIVVGVQMIIFANLVSRMAESQGLQKPAKFSFIMKRIFSFEVSIVVGLTLIALGIFMGFFAVSDWRINNFGAMDAHQLMRQVIPSSLVIMLGLQIALGGALMAGLDMVANSARASR